MNKVLSDILKVFSVRWVYDNLSYILFLTLLTFLYIGNAHYVQKKVRTINALKKEVSEANWKYMNAKSKLMKAAMYSELKESLEAEELGLEGGVPKKINVEEK